MQILFDCEGHGNFFAFLRLLLDRGYDGEQIANALNSHIFEIDARIDADVIDACRKQAEQMSG